MWIISANIQLRGHCYFGPFSNQEHAEGWALENGFTLGLVGINTYTAFFLYTSDRIDEFEDDIEVGRRELNAQAKHT